MQTTPANRFFAEVLRESGRMSKTVLITGASSGIGLATAKLFLAKGWNVVATLRKPAMDSQARLPGALVNRLDVQDRLNSAAVFRRRGRWRLRPGETREIRPGLLQVHAGTFLIVIACDGWFEERSHKTRVPSCKRRETCLQAVNAAVSLHYANVGRVHP